MRKKFCIESSFYLVSNYLHISRKKLKYLLKTFITNIEFSDRKKGVKKIMNKKLGKPDRQRQSVTFEVTELNLKGSYIIRQTVYAQKKKGFSSQR